MKKVAWSVVGLAVGGLGILSYLWFTPGRTPATHRPKGIASLERIRIGGVDQYILIRGNDASLPVVLFLHGGPGMPAMYLAHAFQRELEKDFVVIQWDRRAAGKSYREDISSTLTTEQLVADTVELTNLLRARLHQDRIYLVGHSWGTYLGMLVIARHPELYHAYVGIGQLARSSPIAGIQDEYIRQSAGRMGDQDAIEELKFRLLLPAPPYRHDVERTAADLFDHFCPLQQTQQRFSTMCFSPDGIDVSSHRAQSFDWNLCHYRKSAFF